VLTGEHGGGVEKRDLMPVMFKRGRPEPGAAGQVRLRSGPDPQPGKVFPKLHRCAKLGRLHVHRGEIRFPDLPRF
jgi:glycolate oxidase